MELCGVGWVGRWRARMFLEHRGDLWLSSGLTVLGADGGMGAWGMKPDGASRARCVDLGETESSGCSEFHGRDFGGFRSLSGWHTQLRR